MKVILNKDLSTLGEEGDVKDVARGYARNYLFPRGIALPYTPQTVKLFEARKEEIEAKKAQKRQDALGLKERLENLELTLTMLILLGIAENWLPLRVEKQETPGIDG